MCTARPGRGGFSASPEASGARHNRAFVKVALQQFIDEVRAGAFKWLPLSDLVLERLELAYTQLPPATFLRAADVLHLSAAAGNGFREIYSNDEKLLAATADFGLRGVNVIV